MPSKFGGAPLKCSRKEVAKSEMILLASLLANRRSHRHHLWLRASRVGLHRAQKAFTRQSPKAFALCCRALERAAAECVSEARLVRVDTVGLVTAILAVLARLHLVMSVPDGADPSAVMQESMGLVQVRKARRVTKGSISFREAMGALSDDALSDLE